MDAQIPAQFDVDVFRREVLSDPLVQNVWDNKYRLKRPDGFAEQSIEESKRRVVESIYAKDPDKQALADALDAVLNGYFLPAGRINAGAGTARSVTYLNCFVADTIQDSMPGIQHAIAKDAFTLQQGGGVGADFSTVRPNGALVSRTGSVASGAIAFMEQRSAMSATVCSAGERRGALMTVLRCDHSDLWNEEQFETTDTYTGEKILKNPSFISVKRQAGRLTQTNISVLVTDAFMKAVEDDLDWDLGFFVPRADGGHVAVYDKPFPYNTVEMDNDFIRDAGSPVPSKGQMRPWYVYRRVKARRIWDDIMRSTYKYAEPGVIFIDRVNERNNLNYCEDIQCTNPCGEQPLPPFGCCDLGSVNLAFMVDDPFTSKAKLNFGRLRQTVRVGVRFLDNVLDASNYPLREQREESMRKRRIGLGLTGVADALIQMGVRYGSFQAINYLDYWMQFVKMESYHASAMLAAERGPFPCYDVDKFMKSWNAEPLPFDVQNLIREHGIRNGVLNTIAPNGTISIYSGNVSSGIEPVFSFDKVMRKVRQPDGTLAPYESVDYAYRLYEAINGPTTREDLPDYFAGAMDLTPEEHVRMQAACQEHVDSSISKTVNVPTEMAFEDFKGIYRLAYDTGCKGITTYRFDPDSGRGSVLSVDGPEKAPQEKTISAIDSGVAPRDRVLLGRTYKLKWPPSGRNWYVTINHDETGAPVEVFITGGEEGHVEWIQAMGRLLTAVLRRGGDVRFLVNELIAVHAAGAGGFIAEQHAYRPSIVAAIGGILEEEFKALGLFDSTKAATSFPFVFEQPLVTLVAASTTECPSCHSPTLVHEDGCKRCLTCDYSRCG